MIPLASPVEGIAVGHDVASGRWHLKMPTTAVALRPWTWGERRRLLAAATASGAIDAGVLIAGLFDALLDRVPPDAERDALAVTCLVLLGVGDDDDGVLPLSRAELLAATTFGWAPQELDAQPAADLDRLLALVSPRATVADGWTRIVIAREPACAAEQRLGSLLRTLARLAGLVTGDAPAARPEARGPHVPMTAASAPPAATRRDPAGELTIRGTARLKRGDAGSVPAAALQRSAPDSMAPSVAQSSGPATETPVSPPLRAALADVARARAPSDARPLADADPIRVVRSVGSTPRDIPPASGPRVERTPPARRARALQPFAAASSPARPRHSAVHEPGVAASASRAAAAPVEEFFPTSRAALEWPAVREARDESEPLAMRPDFLPETPFRLSELEEQMADVLERALREAGIDPP